MADEKYTFETARIRLEEIAAEVRKKDTSLEKSLDLLEEGVRLANICTELVDHTDMSAPQGPAVTADAGGPAGADEAGGVDAPGSYDAAPDAEGVPPEGPALDASEGAAGEVDEEYDDEDQPSDVASAE
ncbi:MAG: exodeoxyribonuclease VII small subunit [Coriobacteriia bacterium]|nr:exodeoxyribonuclease VII small subunit [Coriobacteriia bacterium]